MMQSLLRKIGLSAEPDAGAAADQVYTEAAMENAVRQNDSQLVQLAGISERARDVNCKVEATTQLLRIVSADKDQVIAHASNRA